MALKSGRVGIHPSQVDPITGMLVNVPSGDISFEDLSDSQISDPEAGQTLQYNGTGWKNVFASISPTTLATLQDVQITDPEAGQTLQYNGTGWGNVFASIAPTTLATLQDVQITEPEDGEYLTYDSVNSKWINSGEAPAPTYTDLTATIYGAVEDTISFTDAAGISHSEVFASGQSSKSVTFKINPSGSTSITFTSAVAKDPDDLTADYSKSITITDATIEVRVMPDNSLYWYGYESGDLQDCTTANGWSWEGISGYSLEAPTHNTNNIYIAPSASQKIGAIGTKTAISKTVNIVAQVTSVGGSGSNSYGLYSNGYASKAIGDIDASMSGSVCISTVSTQKIQNTLSNKYLLIGAIRPTGATRTSNIYAVWYE